MRGFLLGILVFWGLSGEALEVNLLEVDLQARPGAAFSFSFIVRNELPQPEQIFLYLGDWDRDQFGENRFYEPGTLARSAASWPQVVPTSFVLDPGEVREIQGTDPGHHKCTTFAGAWNLLGHYILCKGSRAWFPIRELWSP